MQNKKSAIDDYWDALDRLKNNTPLRVPKKSPINNDTVALEAGRKRGSIKKSRKQFEELIKAIQNQHSVITKKNKKEKLKMIKLRAKKEEYRNLYHEGLNRELMLVERLAKLEKELKKYENIIPFPGGGQLGSEN